MFKSIIVFLERREKRQRQKLLEDFKPQLLQQVQEENRAAQVREQNLKSEYYNKFRQEFREKILNEQKEKELSEAAEQKRVEDHRQRQFDNHKKEVESIQAQVDALTAARASIIEAINLAEKEGISTDVANVAGDHKRALAEEFEKLSISLAIKIQTLELKKREDPIKSGTMAVDLYGSFPKMVVEPYMVREDS